MRKVIQVGRKGKREDGEALRMAEQIDSRVELIQALIPLGLDAVKDLLQKEVKALAGERYRRGGRPAGRVRWGRQRGSVYLADQKLPIQVPRVRDSHAGLEVPLLSYSRLQQPRSLDVGLLRKVLGGLSCRKYEECAEAVPLAFGLSSSTVSRRYIRASARKLREFMERRLDLYDFVTLVLDGKSFGEDEMVIALGVTVKGEKLILGFVQTATENEKVLSSFLRSLVDRGLGYEAGLLVVIDGAKGLRKAVGKVFGDHAAVQRCQWHKRENVVSYLAKTQQASMRRKLQVAYELPTYEQAKGALLKIRSELKVLNLSAVGSLDEGMEETLTLHRLGLFRELGESLKTTNSLESINAQLGQRTDKVDHWRNSDQKHRWIATALLDIEKSLNKIKGYRHLPRLQEALKRSMEQRISEKAKKAA